MDMDKKTPASTRPQKVTTEQLGVWRLLVDETPSDSIFGTKWEAIVFQMRLVVGLFKDIYDLGPNLFILVILGVCWSGIRDSLLLYFASRLLTIVSASTTSSGVGLLTRRTD
jgi:hypothetical protein